MPAAAVQRFDFASIRSKPTRTPQGFLRIDANLTRVGVLLYRNEDGTVRRELRLPEEVFRDDSLTTLGGAPVTDLHPSDGLVSPVNVRELQRGHVSESIEHDERFVNAPVIVQDQALIEMVEKGERKELSPGYTCHLDETPGEWNGEKYDAIQRDIVYNHLAIGPKGWGRSGSEVALKMDSGLISFESKVTTNPTGGPTAIANLPEPSDAVGQFVRAKLGSMDKSTGHLAEALDVDVWAVEAFLDGVWNALRDNKLFLADPGGDKAREPMTGLARPEQFADVAKFIDVPVETLFELVPVAERGDGGRNPQRQQRKDAMADLEMKELELDGTKFSVPAAIAPTVDQAIQNLKKKAEDAQKDAGHLEEEKEAEKAKADAANVRADAADKARDEIQVRLDEALSPEAIGKLVKARVDLESTARKIVGDKADFAGKSDMDVKNEVIKHVDSAFDPEGKSESYLQGRFDATVAGSKDGQARIDRNDEVAIAAAAARRVGADEPDAEKARADAAERNQNAWKQDLTHTRQKGASA